MRPTAFPPTPFPPGTALLRSRLGLRYSFLNMKLPRLYPILDTESLEARGIGLQTAASAMLAGGAGILQFRHKGHWSREAFEAARGVARLCRDAGAQFVVNDRADFAMLLEAGLHVGQDDLSPRDARMLLGPDALLGFSSHNAEQIRARPESRWTMWRSARCFPLFPNAGPILWPESKRCAAARAVLQAAGGHRRHRARQRARGSGGRRGFLGRNRRSAPRGRHGPVSS